MNAPDFHPLPPDALVRMARQRTFVHVLEVLQRLIDARIPGPDRTWELQCLGVAFGDVLTRLVDGLAWCEVTDEFGTDPTLRFRRTGYNVNALTMISRRIESGRPVDLADLVGQIRATLEAVPNT